MQPDGEQPENPSAENRPPMPRQRSIPGSDANFQRRPPLSRGRPETTFQRPTINRPVPVERDVTPPVDRPVVTEAPQQPQHNQQTVFPPQLNDQQFAEPTSSISEPNPNPVDQVPPQSPQPQHISFAPPPKKRLSKLIKFMLIILAVIVMLACVIGFAKMQAAKNKPATVMQDALNSNLSIKSMQSETVNEKANIDTKYDFTAPKDVRTNTDAKFKLPKGDIDIESYGSTKNTYISYHALPKSISADIAKRTKDGWVQLKNNSVSPKSVTPPLSNISDPHYLAFGPLLMGNFESKTRDQLIKFIVANKVYGYDEKAVKKEKIDGKKMFVFPIKLDVSYLKIASQSAAVNYGLDPTQIQAATDAMEELRGAKVTLYVNAKDHTFAKMKIEKNGNTKTITLTNFDSTQLPEEPQTKLQWQNFLPIQNVINTQTALTKAGY